jgi:hypothetical protein
VDPGRQRSTIILVFLSRYSVHMEMIFMNWHPSVQLQVIITDLCTPSAPLCASSRHRHLSFPNILQLSCFSCSSPLSLLRWLESRCWDSHPVHVKFRVFAKLTCVCVRLRTLIFLNSRACRLGVYLMSAGSIYVSMN